MQPEQARSPVGPESSSRLGGARADFVGGLGRKVADLRNTLGRVRAEPESAAARDELRRKIHALGSAAKMMKFDAMDRAIAEVLGVLDRTPRSGSLDSVDLATLDQTIEDLPALAWGDGPARSSRIEAIKKASEPRYTALVIGTALIAEALLDTDGPAPLFRCESTPDAQAAFDLVRAKQPDLVILDADIPCATELAFALMDETSTETIPIVVVGSFLEQGEEARYIAMGVARTVAKPTSRECLRDVCRDTLEPARTPAPTTTLGEPTLAELGDRLANEIREALVGRVDSSAHAQKIPLGEGTEIMSAVWGAISRVREVVIARTDGAVRFGAGPQGGLPFAPSLHEPDVARADRARSRTRGVAAEVKLQGRRVVVADDDPAVVWFLADLLKTVGCTVYEAFDGRQALELAYRTSPDLVISDILMPELDGFSLCRALKRDVALRDTPVILLSWKEDLLKRVRELGAGAAGYVRKESDTRAIVARVREALRPRSRIEARLREDGEVRGRLDELSVRSLLEIVCATRPEARVSVRDASFLYEVEIRWGAPHRATRTAGDGSFVKGTKVLAAMLGVGAGRFTVATSTSEVDAELDGNLAAQLKKPIARARAAMALLATGAPKRAARLHFDEESLEDYLQATPLRARTAVARLTTGISPRDLVLEGTCDPILLDDISYDLAARGFITAIEDEDGEDMLAPMTRVLLEQGDARASFAPKTSTPSPLPALTEALVPTPSCANDIAAPLCDSPDPGVASSLADAVMREVIHRSPEPSQAELPIARAESSVDFVDPGTLKLRTSPPPPACEDVYGTPPVDQILALGEATVIDDTLYEENEPIEPEQILSSTEAAPEPTPTGGAGRVNESIPIPQELTPFASVADDAGAAGVPAKRRKWPMFAFMAVTGLVAWAVFHYGARPLSALKQPEATPPAMETTLPPAPEPATQASATPTGDAVVTPAPAATEVTYTPVAAEAVIPAGHGVLDVMAPPDAVVVVDGAERARGSATLPISPGAHHVRVRGTEEHDCTIDVRSSRVAHVKF